MTTEPHPPKVLWATPRTVSTAFERMVMERGDHIVLTEPFSLAFYHGVDAASGRYAHWPTRPGCSYAEVLARIEAMPGRVFVKDMAYQLGPLLDDLPLDLERWQHAFLVRDPAWSLPSMARHWPHFDDVEAGYEAQRRLFDRCAEALGAPPMVIESTALRADPDRVVRAWSAAMGLDHRPEALHWEPGLPDQWREWEPWFRTTAESDGFLPPDGRPAPEVDGDLAAAIDRARPHFEHMVAHAV